MLPEFLGPSREHALANVIRNSDLYVGSELEGTALANSLRSNDADYGIVFRERIELEAEQFNGSSSRVVRKQEE